MSMSILRPARVVGINFTMDKHAQSPSCFSGYICDTIIVALRWQTGSHLAVTFLQCWEPKPERLIAWSANMKS